MSAYWRDATKRIRGEVVPKGEVIELGQEEGVFLGGDSREGATVVRALVDGLFTQWIQEKDWEKTHAEYREICKRSVLTYLTASA